ncbi:MAG: saccharopine dehydrogenase C-terminal domain-containing protein [Pseudomonadota bacterium]
MLVLGSGQSTTYLVAKLLEDAVSEDLFVTVGDRDLAAARASIGDHPRGTAVQLDINDAGLRSAEIERSALVVNMLPSTFHHLVAWDCVSHGRDMLSVSYREQTTRDLDLDAKRQGILLLSEMGLDPGIDHMSAMALIRRVQAAGGRIDAFRSYGSGIPAPNQPHNPLRYVLTWDPRNVVMAGQAGAQYLDDGDIKIVPFHHVFLHTWPCEVQGVGTLEAYANRDALSYMQSFGLEHVQTMIRGTLRYPGWSETWNQIVHLGLPNETLCIPELARRSYAEVVEMFLPTDMRGGSIEQRTAHYLQISPTGRIMENLRWLGLFSEEPIGCRGDTSCAMMIHLLKEKLSLAPDQRDLVLLVHELEVSYPDRPGERITSTFAVEGEPGGFTAMSRTVGLPVAIAAKLKLRGELSLTGSLIPTHPAIYEPILAEIEAAGLRFTERRDPLTMRS